MSLEELIKKFGLSGNFVRAYCKQQGWRYGKNGAPKEWYDAWVTGLAKEIESVVSVEEAPVS